MKRSSWLICWVVAHPAKTKLPSTQEGFARTSLAYLGVTRNCKGQAQKLAGIPDAGFSKCWALCYVLCSLSISAGLPGGKPCKEKAVERMKEPKRRTVPHALVEAAGGDLLLWGLESQSWCKVTCCASLYKVLVPQHMSGFGLFSAYPDLLMLAATLMSTKALRSLDTETHHQS